MTRIDATYDSLKGGPVLLRQFRTGGDRNFGYLVADEDSKAALVVDPSYSPESIVQFARAGGYRILYAFCTHDHSDHTNGNRAFAEASGIRPLIHGERDPATGTLVEDGALFPLGPLEARILHTPGHTLESICIAAGDAVFTGDTLFVGKVGGTDLHEGARREYASLHEKLMTLPPETRVFPGHDYGTAPESTIRREKETNPFLLRPDFESFVDLKRNWAAYKKEHGIA